MKTKNTLKVGFNLSGFELISEQTDGRLMGGFSASIGTESSFAIGEAGGSNNCNGGNCVAGCGTGQNASGCNVVAGCGG